MMKLNKSTRYALYAAMEMARDEAAQVTAAHVAERYSIPAAVMAKVLQQLVRAGIVVGTRGSGGGYRLAEASSATTVLDVIEAFEPRRGTGSCLLDDGDNDDCAHPGDCRLRELFDEVDELARCTFASITLETLAGRPQPGRGAVTTAAAGRPTETTT